ncbi:MAG: hypothetical protein SFW35_14145 [Chitinophagales bacterium]|nr:hypothetical protein [Chitinophagales bacterium]
MKKSTDDLFALISKLTLSERRYCALYLAKHTSSGTNRYLQLFHFLKKQPAYNSAATAGHLNFSDKPNHYAVLKNQLYDLILNALHQYDLFSNQEQQLLVGIHQCQLLLQKGLLKQSLKRINVYSKLAAEMEHYEGLLLLQELKLTIMARNYYKNVGEQVLDEWFQNTQGVTSSLQQALEIKWQASHIYRLQYESGLRGKALAAKMESYLRYADTPLQSTKAQLDYLQAQALYHFTNLETAKAAQCNQRFLEILDGKPKMLKQYADRYFSVLNNYLIDCLVMKRYGRLQQGISKLRGLSSEASFKKLANFELNVFRLGYMLELNYFINNGLFTDAFQQISTIETGLATYGDRIIKHNRFTLLYLMAYAAFGVQEYEKSLELLRPILQEKEASVAEDIQLAAKMLELLCHYELDNNLLLESLLKSIRRWKKAHPPIIKRVLRFIASREKKTPVLADWIKLAEEMEKEATQATSAQVLNAFNYLVWAVAKANDTNFEAYWQKATSASGLNPR